MLLIRSKVTGTVPEHKSYPFISRNVSHTDSRSGLVSRVLGCDCPGDARPPTTGQPGRPAATAQHPRSRRSRPSAGRWAGIPYPRPLPSPLRRKAGAPPSKVTPTSLKRPPLFTNFVQDRKSQKSISRNLHSPGPTPRSVPG